MKGIDYAWGRPDALEIKAQGFDFVCRYLSFSSGKNLNPPELHALRSVGLSIVLVWETTEQRPLAGYEAGKNDALEAQKQVSSLLEEDSKVVLYFACDSDFSASNQPSINRYFQGVNDVIGIDRTGIYGSYDVVRRTLDAGLAKYAWQTYAWSHGKWDERAQLRQTKNGVPVIDHVMCDTDEAVTDDFGQFP